MCVWEGANGRLSTCETNIDERRRDALWEDGWSLLGLTLSFLLLLRRILVLGRLPKTSRVRLCFDWRSFLARPRCRRRLSITSKMSSGTEPEEAENSDVNECEAGSLSSEWLMKSTEDPPRELNA